MKNILKTLLFFVAIPAIAFAVSFACEAKLNADLRTSIAKSQPDVDQAALAKLEIHAFLGAVDDPSLSSLRRDVGLLGSMRVAAIAVIVFFLVFLALVKTFGTVSSKSRKALLRLFRPTYFATSLLLPLATLANAALLIGAIYFGESFLIERVHVKLILLIGIGAALGCLAVAKSVLESLKKTAMDLDGEPAAEGSALKSFVDAIAAEIGSERIENVVLGEGMTFFATEAQVRVGGQTLAGKTVYISRPLAGYLSPPELKSIVAHELGHFKGLDTAYSMKFYPIYRGLGLSMERLEQSGGAMALALIPTRVMYNVLFESFALSERKLGRERELAADGEAVAATDALTFSAALLKVSALLDVWGKSLERAKEAPPDAGEEASLAVAYFAEADKAIAEEERGRMLEAEVFHPFDTHPSVKERILATGIEPVRAFAAIDFAPAERACALFA
jgi:Zn-dependent protease with chaperone function